VDGVILYEESNFAAASGCEERLLLTDSANFAAMPGFLLSKPIQAKIFA